MAELLQLQIAASADLGLRGGSISFDFESKLADFEHRAKLTRQPVHFHRAFTRKLNFPASGKLSFRVNTGSNRAFWQFNFVRFSASARLG